MDILIGFIIPSAELATTKTYYVDATGGLDTNTGTSTTDAWQTIAKVNAATLNPGDKVYFKRGETWTNERLNVPAAGESGNHIIFGAYGTGNRPIIDAGTQLNAFRSRYSYITVENIEFIAGTSDCVDLYNVTENNISNCVVHGTGGRDGMYISAMTNCTINDCEVYGMERIGISVANSCDGITFNRCTTRDNVTTVSADGCSVANSSNITFNSCVFSGNNNGDSADGCQVATSTNVTFLRCDFINNYNTGLIFSSASSGTVAFCEFRDTYRNAFVALVDADGLDVYNNTFAGGEIYGLKINAVDAAGTVTVKNNIFANLTYLFYVDTAVSGTVTSDYNLFYDGTGTGQVHWKGTTYSYANFANYQSASSQDANAQTGDPDFNNAASDDYTLGDLSLAVNTGTATLYTTDHDGNGVPYGDNVDIGAYERQSAIPPPEGYYVSKSGSDSNAGTFAAPWLTLAHAASNLPAGGTVHVLNGTYSERITITTNNTTWVADNDGVYMQGFRVNGANGTIIDNFNISSTVEGWMGGGIWIYGQTNGCTIKNCRFTDNYGPCVNATYVFADWVSNVTVDNCYAYKCGGGFWAEGYNWTIKNCEVERLYKWGSTDSDAFRGNGQGHLIQDNYAHGTIVTEIGTSHSDGFQCFDNDDPGAVATSGIIIERNRFMAGGDQGIIMSDIGYAGVDDIIIRNNIIRGVPESEQAGVVGYHDNNNLGLAHGVLADGATNIKVYNNTFITVRNTRATDSATWGNGISTMNGGSVTAYNNIFYDCERVMDPAYGGGTAGTITEDYNCADVDSNGDLTGSNDIVDDPTFTDYANKDYSLATGSPCIDAGTDSIGASVPSSGYWQFDGSSSVVEMGAGTEAALDLPDADWAIAGWFNYVGGGLQPPLLWQYCSGSALWYVYFNTSLGDTPRFYALPYEVTTGTTGLRDSTWHHILLQRSGTASSAVVTMYIDGAIIKTDSARDWPAFDADVPAQFGYGSYYYQGALAYWAKWDRALTSEEITTLQTQPPDQVATPAWYATGLVGEGTDEIAGLTLTETNIAASADGPSIGGVSTSISVTDDITGRARPVYNGYDIGAYEYVG